MINLKQKSFSLNNFYQQFLDQIIAKNSISNAYIFYGPENIGKKEIAIEFIVKIMNQSISEPNSIQTLYENNHPDFIFIEPTYIHKGNLIKKTEFNLENKNNQPIIRIDQIRKLNQFISRKAIKSDKKFILIEDAHLLNEASSNCLLKTLEEPTNGVFILLTSRLNLLLDTIISRCQTIRFKPSSYQELKQILEQSKHDTTDLFSDSEILENLIFISNGSPGKLVNNLEIWHQIPENIKNDIKYPLKNYESILFLAKHITSELNLNQQEFLLNYMQRDWWKKTQNKKFTEILEGIKNNISSNIQPRIAWEVGLLKVKLKDS